MQRELFSVMLTDMITITRAEHDRLRQAERYYESRYERQADEMRRMIDQAHEQIGVGVRDLTTAIARIKELEARIKELEADSE